MSSSDIAISPFQARDLLRNARVDDPGVTKNGNLEQIMAEMKNYIEGKGSQGFTTKAMEQQDTDEYTWARTTPAGIIWLWSKQTPDIQGQWLSKPIKQLPIFEPPPSPSPSPSQPYGWTPSAPRNYTGTSGIDYGLSESVPRSGGGSRRRRTRKTRRKSSRGRSRSRGHRIRRKKTHNRRHRR